MILRDYLSAELPRWFGKLQRYGLLPGPWEQRAHVSLTEASAAGFGRIEEISIPHQRLEPFVKPATDEASQGYLEEFRKFDDRVSIPFSYGAYHASNVKIWPEFGVHHTSQGSLSDVYCNRAALANPKYELPRLILPVMPTGRQYEAAIYLGVAWYHNHYHWLVDIVPRLDLVRDELAADLPVIVPPFLRSTQLEILKMALHAAGKPDAVIIQPTQRTIRVSQLVMPTQIARPLDLIPQQRKFLRDAMSGFESEAGRRQRIYISRSDALIRRIVNENEVESMLKEAGFITVTLGSLSLAEQVNLFANAECVVGHHGAGFSNSLFCKPGTKIIEIFQNGHFSPSFARMAQIGGLDYGYCVGAPVGRDTEAPLKALAELLERFSLT